MKTAVPSLYVDLTKPSLHLALLAIAFNPTAWNVVARNEYRNKTLTRLLGGNARRGCYLLAALIFGFGLLRDTLYGRPIHIYPFSLTLAGLLSLNNRYHRALEAQPRATILPAPYDTLVPAALFIVGQIFVLTSTWALGITGTFLGDYFGILMDHRVTGFPFNVLQDPMYVGSTMCFAAGALWYERPAGLLVTLYVYVVYVIALKYEGPFTDMIYTKWAERVAKKAKST